MRCAIELITGLYAMKGSVQMANKIEVRSEGRKAWVAPELRRLRAGAAEAGGGEVIPDGGDPNRSDRS
jgi:hypothetical protein